MNTLIRRGIEALRKLPLVETNSILSAIVTESFVRYLITGGFSFLLAQIAAAMPTA